MRTTAIVLTILAACDSPSAEDAALAQMRQLVASGPYLDINIAELPRQYDANPVSADARYKRKAIRFTAPVSNVIKGREGEPLVFFGPGENSNLIGCAGMNPDVVRLMDRGQVRTIRGAFIGQVGGIAMAMFCEIEWSK